MKERDGDKDQLELNEEGFYEDPRYKQCNREAIYGVLLGIGNLIWWFAFGYGLGDRPVSEYSYILGFPSWFFMSSVLGGDRKSTRLNSSHVSISYAVFCLKKKKSLATTSY